jgi:hypothetical protein
MGADPTAIGRPGADPRRRSALTAAPGGPWRAARPRHARTGLLIAAIVSLAPGCGPEPDGVRIREDLFRYHENRPLTDPFGGGWRFGSLDEIRGLEVLERPPALPFLRYIVRVDLVDHARGLQYAAKVCAQYEWERRRHWQLSGTELVSILPIAVHHQAAQQESCLPLPYEHGGYIDRAMDLAWGIVVYGAFRNRGRGDPASRLYLQRSGEEVPLFQMDDDSAAVDGSLNPPGGHRPALRCYCAYCPQGLYDLRIDHGVWLRGVHVPAGTLTDLGVFELGRYTGASSFHVQKREAGTGPATAVFRHQFADVFATLETASEAGRRIPGIRGASGEDGRR